MHRAGVLGKSDPRNIELRCVEISGEPWFVAKDVCAALGLINTTMALISIPVEEKGFRSIETLGGKQRANLISESGLYKLVMRSDKPQAKDFQHWVTAVVLPAIRKDGTPRRRWESHWQGFGLGPCLYLRMFLNGLRWSPWSC